MGIRIPYTEYAFIPPDLPLGALYRTYATVNTKQLKRQLRENREREIADRGKMTSGANVIIKWVLITVATCIVLGAVSYWFLGNGETIWSFALIAIISLLVGSIAAVGSSQTQSSYVRAAKAKERYFLMVHSLAKAARDEKDFAILFSRRQALAVTRRLGVLGVTIAIVSIFSDLGNFGLAGGLLLATWGIMFEWRCGTLFRRFRCIRRSNAN